ncbi:hypothetical protein BCR32DRAFT_287134, partial [Anaeromyces robustus]
MNRDINNLEINLKMEASTQEEKKVSFSKLFKYYNMSEKILIVFGVIFSIILGCCLPNIPLLIGKLFDVIIGTVMNINIKKMTNIKDDSLLESMMTALLSHDPNRIQIFKEEHPEVDFSSISSKFQNSQAAGGTTTSISFNTIDTLMNDLYSIIYKFLIVASIALVSGFLAYFCLYFTSSRLYKKIHFKVLKTILNKNLEWDETTTVGELSSKIKKDILEIKESTGFGI